MTEDLIWQKLEALRPSLPRHIHIQRRDYHQETWYLLQDKSNGRFHRLTPTAWRLIAAMDGRHSLQQVLAIASNPEFYLSQDEIPTREELIQLLQYLHVADLLVCDMPPSTQELFSRQQRKQRQPWVRLFMNPLTWNIPLGNPDRILERLMPLARVLTSRGMGVIWLVVVGYALLQAGNHWSQLTHGHLNRVLSPGNLLLVWLTYPCLKFIHELGHGLFVKAWGGSVNDFGIVFVLGTPLPYVDASAATGFHSKTRRMMVSAAGMAVELFIAAIALLIWLQLPAGLLKDFLYNLMLIGGVSTLFFNGNPLMRFDGYHLLIDALDLPNLATRANQQLSYLMRRYGYGITGLTSPAQNYREATVFTVYACSAFIYRLTVLFFICVLIASHFPGMGLVLVAWLIFFQLCWPFLSYVHYLLGHQQLQINRKRALLVSGGLFVGALLAFSCIPLPRSTAAEGVVWLPETARIKAGASGEVVELLVEDGQEVTAGQVLMRLENPVLLADLATQQASLREFEARYQRAWADDRAEAQLLQQDIESIQASIDHLQAQVNSLAIVSPVPGIFRLTRHYFLIGSYLNQGDEFALIDNLDALRIRAALTQEEIGLVRQASLKIEARFASQLAKNLSATIIQEVPAATQELPSPVLGTRGGGRLALDATKPGNLNTAEKIFLVDLQLDGDPLQRHYGERVYVKFVHPAEPGLVQVYRALQQLFIRSLS